MNIQISLFRTVYLQHGHSSVHAAGNESVVWYLESRVDNSTCSLPDMHNVDCGILSSQLKFADDTKLVLSLSIVTTTAKM